MPRGVYKFVVAIESVGIVPLLVWVVVPVLLVRMQTVFIFHDAAAYSSDVTYGDPNSWWKAVVLVGTGLWLGFHFTARKIAGKKLKFPVLGILEILAAVWVLLSSCRSLYPQTAWLGFTTLFEGGLVLLAYLAALYYAAETVEDDKTRALLLRAIGVVGFINAVHGILEGLGWNFWSSSIGLWLMGAGDTKIFFRFADVDMAHGTVFQPNHYGMLMAMLTMLSLGMAFCEQSKGWRLFWAVNTLCGWAAVVFSNSRMAFATCILLGIAHFAERLYAAGSGKDRALWRGFYLKWGVGALLCLMLAMGAVLSGLLPLGRFGEATRTLVGRLVGTFTDERDEYSIQAMELWGTAINLHLAGGDALKLERHSDFKWVGISSARPNTRANLSFRIRDDGWGVAELPGVEGATLKVKKDGSALIEARGTKLRFFILGNEILAVDYNDRVYWEIPKAPAIGLGGAGKLLGGRGHIWSRGLAAVAASPVFGVGPGCFAMAFPNYELVAKQHTMDHMDEDKGHGIWMTFPIQLGLVGALAYFLPFAYIFRRMRWRAAGMDRALALGIAAFVLGAVTNDSTVGVTPIFCVLAGLALSRAAPAK